MSTLETRIAEAVAQALELEDDDNGVWHTRPPSEHPALIAAALAPVIRERDAATWESALNLALDHGIIYDADIERLKKLNPYRSNDV